MSVVYKCDGCGMEIAPNGLRGSKTYGKEPHMITINVGSSSGVTRGASSINQDYCEDCLCNIIKGITLKKIK